MTCDILSGEASFYSSLHHTLHEKGDICKLLGRQAGKATPGTLLIVESVDRWNGVSATAAVRGTVMRHAAAKQSGS